MEIKSKNRIQIPIDLYNHSNLKGCSRFLFVWRGKNKILILPETANTLKKEKIAFAGKIDSKHRIYIPMKRVGLSEKRLESAFMYVENKQIVIELGE